MDNIYTWKNAITYFSTEHINPHELLYCKIGGNLFDLGIIKEDYRYWTAANSLEQSIKSAIFYYAQDSTH